MVNTDDLCDAHEVAALLGLSHPNSVFGYLRRYADMPRPVVIGGGAAEIALWLRPDASRPGARPAVGERTGRRGARGRHDPAGAATIPAGAGVGAS